MKQKILGNNYIMANKIRILKIFKIKSKFKFIFKHYKINLKITKYKKKNIYKKLMSNNKRMIRINLKMLIINL